MPQQLVEPRTHMPLKPKPRPLKKKFSKRHPIPADLKPLVQKTRNPKLKQMPKKLVQKNQNVGQLAPNRPLPKLRRLRTPLRRKRLLKLLRLQRPRPLHPRRRVEPPHQRVPLLRVLQRHKKRFLVVPRPKNAQKVRVPKLRVPVQNVLPHQLRRKVKPLKKPTLPNAHPLQFRALKPQNVARKNELHPRLMQRVPKHVVHPLRHQRVLPKRVLQQVKPRLRQRLKVRRTLLARLYRHVPPKLKNAQKVKFRQKRRLLFRMQRLNRRAKPHFAPH